MSEARFLVGDVFDRMADIPDGSIDLIVTSPPFLALRSYLPADHPDKAKEIGSEPTPAAFLSTLLALTREWRRVLAPHGSICVELGDTYSGSGPGATTTDGFDTDDRLASRVNVVKGKVGWPLAKSLCLLPTLYPASLAYGWNMLDPLATVQGRRFEPWRVRNLIVWHRPNPPVGALGDKVRPSTSYITTACVSDRRWFDLDSERTEHKGGPHSVGSAMVNGQPRGDTGGMSNPAGAPPLDAWFDTAEQDVWAIPTAPYAGTTSTVRRVPCGPDDGGERTMSPDCPRHAGLPGQLPKALRDERAGSRSSRISRNGHDPEQGQLLADATSDSTPDHSGSSPAPTSAQPVRKGSGAATRHDTESSRTGHAPSTSRPDTPSVETTRRTGRTPTSLESVELHHDTTASSTSSDGSAESPAPQTESRIAGNSSAPDELACTCSFFKRVKESTSHYATFPPALPRRLINLMCPRQVCTSCGEPRRRITSEPTYVPGPHFTGHGRAKGRPGGWEIAPARIEASVIRTTQTLGWSDCECPCRIHDIRSCTICTDELKWRRGIVLDPFAGSGTTLQAASELGRDSIGLDLDSRNLDLARSRLGMFLIEEETVP